MSDVSLSAGIRSNLFSLQKTSDLLSRTTDRLSTGRKVASPLDNPTAFFQASNLNDRAVNLDRRLDAMGQAVSTIKAADNGIKAARGLVSALKGKVDEALTQTDSNQRWELGLQFNELLVQINNVAKDSSYAGVNLMYSGGDNPESLTIQFSESYNESTLTVEGFMLGGAEAMDEDGKVVSYLGTTPGRSLFGILVADEGGNTVRKAEIKSADNEDSIFNGDQSYDWVATTDNAYKDNLTALVEEIEDFDQELVNQSKKLNTSLAVITIRQDFTKESVDIYEGGADKLTLADLNEEGANLLSLQTSQTLGIQALALSSQTSQAILRLVG